MEEVDCIVIGAGVAGLSVARELAMAGREVIVAERAAAIGTETSSRNSEVIHAGLYYSPGSLKARLCVEGKRLLYTYCAERGVQAKAIGKLLVATDDNQIAKLKSIKETAERNGLSDLSWLSREEAQKLEPDVTCIRALYSPSSGIVDSHGFMLALQGDLEEAGGVIALESAVEGGRPNGERVVLRTSGADPMELSARLVVNAAGLHAPAIAAALEIPPAAIPKSYLAKGSYFALSGVSAPFRHLIYPMPDEASLGIHATLDLAGAVRFGPDVEWVETLDYDVDPGLQSKFETSIRQYWPSLPERAIAPSYSGIRPKIAGPGEPAADFMIQGPDQHRIPGVWNLFGIESPGLTASMALGREVCRRISENT